MRTAGAALPSVGGDFLIEFLALLEAGGQGFERIETYAVEDESAARAAYGEIS